jgi:hypothetical protein
LGALVPRERARGVRGQAGRITNDPILARLSGTQALQCTRLVTVTLRTGEVELLVAFQKPIVGQRAGSRADLARLQQLL